MKLAIVQMQVGMNKAQNLASAKAQIAQAARSGADMVALPEMFCCPYANFYFVQNAEPKGGTIWTAMSEAAKENGVYLIAGSMPERDGVHLYNTSFVFDRQGNQIARHRKMHLFDIDIHGRQKFCESDTFEAGNEVTVFDTEFGKIGVCICFDIRFPELFTLMAQAGAELVVVPASFNMTTGPMHWVQLFCQRAVDNQLFCAGVASARDADGVYVSYANSILTSPWGTVEARAATKEETLLVTLDFEENHRVRQQLPLMSAKRHDLYEVTWKKPQ